jgi:hypothetical protein
VRAGDERCVVVGAEVASAFVVVEPVYRGLRAVGGGTACIGRKATGRVPACVASRQAQHFDAAHAWVGGLVEIGEPERTYTVEPVEDPLPRERPAEPAERPARPLPAEEPIEPEGVPAP